MTRVVSFSRVALATLVLVVAPRTTWAGGFELPDNGAQALGRGAAFVAKADDGSAIQHNPAGLARQRGTRLYANANLFLHSFEFQRSGAFPDDPKNTSSPWGGQGFPVVSNSGTPNLVPLLAVSTDFASLDRLTVALGVFAPPTSGVRTFPIGLAGSPAASRYDLVQSTQSIVYPTAAAAYRVTKWLDLGLSGHLVLARFDSTTISFTDSGDACVNVEFQPCDLRNTLAATATSFGATLGAMVRPSPSVAIGLSVRSPIRLEAAGAVTPRVATGSTVKVDKGQATLTTKLPLMAKIGARYIAMDQSFERYDLELDGTFEGWSGAQGDGPRLQIPTLGDLKDIDTLVVHGYSNTVGLRAGGAFNFEALDGVLSVRAGSYFDSSATNPAYTRVDVDTLSKIAGTIGFGYRRGAFGLDVGYAAVASLSRVVDEGTGAIRPVNFAKNGKPLDRAGKLLPAVNEGAYRGFTNVFAASLSVTFDQLFASGRQSRYGNPYEQGYVGEDGKGGEADDTQAKPPEAVPEVPAVVPDAPKAEPAPEKRKPTWWEEDNR